MFENIVRKARPEEIHFYEKILYPLQDDIFLPGLVFLLKWECISLPVSGLGANTRGSSLHIRRSQSKTGNEKIAGARAPAELKRRST